MAYNPWYVDSILEFSFFKCSECIYDAKEEDKFQNHAVENHPLSFVLFGKSLKEEFSDHLRLENQLSNEVSYEAENLEDTSLANFELKFSIIEKAEITESSKEIALNKKNVRKTFKCSDCGKVYSQKHALKYHIETVHRDWNCSGKDSCETSKCLRIKV